MIGICCKVVSFIRFCKVFLSIRSCRNNYTCLALDLLSFRASKPDCEFDSCIFILAAFIYCISKTVDTVVFYTVEGRDFYTVDLVSDCIVACIFRNHVRTCKVHSKLISFEHCISRSFCKRCCTRRKSFVDEVDPALDTFHCLRICISCFCLIFI